MRVALICAAPAAALLPLEPALVEGWYSTGVYPRLQRLLTPASNLVPFAWLDLAGGGVLAACGWLWARSLRRPGEALWRRLVRPAGTMLAGAALAYLVFLALWGFNYRRIPMERRLELGAAAASTAEVAALGLHVARQLNGLHGRAHERGWGEPPWRHEPLRHAFAAVQRELADGPAAVPGRLKRSLLGVFFRWTAVDGMVNPFGLEVLANPDLLPFERPFVAAHEWAHLAGYADEADANFVGWLTAVRADVPAQYSGWLYLYWQVAGELPRDERRLVDDALADGPRRDIAAIAARMRRGDLPRLRRASWAIYDSYLKANRVEEGVRSYGAVVTLILRARFDEGWRPVRRGSPPRAAERPAPLR